MDMTWRIHSNIRGHDGVRFTSDDLRFMFELRKNPALATLGTGGGRPDLMQSATAPDPYTFVIHWSQVYVRANEAAGLDPLPRPQTEL